MEIAESIIPKYYRVKQILLEEIKSGKYQPGSKLPPEDELMKIFKISRGTVRHALGELVKENIVYTIQGKGCFVTSQQPVSLKPSSVAAKRIIFIINYILNEFYLPVLKGIIDVIQAEGYNLEIYSSEGDYNWETQLISSKCIEQQIAGLIFVPAYPDKQYRHLLSLKNKSIPVVLLDRDLPGYDFDYVGTNNIKMARKVVRHIIKMGRKKIAFIGVQTYISSVKERLEGYRRALKSAGIRIIPELIVDYANDHLSMKEQGEYGIRTLLERGVEFNGIFAVNDGVAISAYSALKERGIRVPDEVFLAGFDNSRDVQNLRIPFITVEQDTYGFGKKAAEIILKKLKGEMSPSIPEKIHLDGKLIIIESNF